MFICSTIAASVVDLPVLITGENLEILGQLQLVHGSDVGVDHAEHNFDPKPLPNHAGAVAGELVCVRKIRIAARIEFFFIDVGHKGFGQRRGVLGSEPRRVRPDWLQASMQTPSRPRVRGQMDIGCAGLLPDLQIVIHVPQRMRFDGNLWRLSDHGRCRNNYAAWPSA